MNKFLIAIVVAVVLIGAILFWQNMTPSMEVVTPTPAPAPTTPTPAPTPTSSLPVSATVTYNGTSFSPSEVRVAKGATVSWINSSSKDMWVASAAHPSHTVYAGTSLREHCAEASNTAFDQCQGGGNYSFTFDKVGTWGYHDHLTPSASGKIIVE